MDYDSRAVFCRFARVKSGVTQIEEAYEACSLEYGTLRQVIAIAAAEDF
jgi:hypothetical protein